MKIAVILPRIPYPLEKGDKLRAFHQIRCLAANNEIYLFALDADHSDLSLAKEKLLPFCKEVNFYHLSPKSIVKNVITACLVGKPLQVGYFYNKKVQKEISNRINAINPDHIYCQLIRTAEYAKNLPQTKTIDYQDVFSMGAKRQIKSAPIWLKPALYTEHKRLVKYENKVFDVFDLKTIISIPDRDLIQHTQKEEIAIIRNGVDFNFFSPEYTKEKKYDLVFTGNMSYAPNINACEYLVNKIMPLVWKQNPNVKIQLAGATPDKRVSVLESPKVTITGWMDDIRDAYASSKIFIAPMQIGTGLQNKLLEAMAMKIPSITSSLANNALKAEDNKEILVANNEQEFADKILELLSDKSFADKIAEAGQQFILRNYSWEAATQELENKMKKN
ncbi:MAG: glycosyltransferase [Bacteroidales bacterium]